MKLDAEFPPAAFAKIAAAAVEAVVERGAERLIAEPWRAARILRGAEALTIDQLRNEVARRQALRAPADFNRALALAQLARALERPGFAAAWPQRAAGSVATEILSAANG